MQANGEVRNFEAQVYRKNGDIIWITENAREVRDRDGRLLFYEGTVEDISERKYYEQQIEYQATHDMLTGLPNRTVLSDRLQQAINFAARYDNILAVAFVDLDQFKFINDSMGHHVGDSLLVVMAERLAQCVRDSDTVVRLGGDEFVLLLCSLQKIEDISHSMQRILAAVAAPCTIDGLEFVVSCSIGISVYPGDGQEAGTLLKHADSAMYKAKQLGRNNFQFYTRELNQVLTERMAIEYRCATPSRTKNFCCITNPKSNWPAAGFAAPKPDPLAAARRRFNFAAEFYSDRRRNRPNRANRPLGTATSLSGRQPLPTNPGPAAAGCGQRVAAPISPARFDRHHRRHAGRHPSRRAHGELEITESCLAHDTPQFIKTLHGLKALGLTLAIDDFGTGYSSMAYLKDFPVDRLKIDKAFVGNLEHESTDAAILKAIIALGHSLGLKVVAEASRPNSNPPTCCKTAAMKPKVIGSANR